MSATPKLQIRQRTADGEYYIVHVARSYRDVMIASHVEPDWRHRLAACADLLAALDGMMRVYGELNHLPEVRAAHAAIAKANEGGQ